MAGEKSTRSGFDCVAIQFLCTQLMKNERYLLPAMIPSGIVLWTLARRACHLLVIISRSLYRLWSVLNFSSNKLGSAFVV